jgi:hypothetical protein
MCVCVWVMVMLCLLDIPLNIKILGVFLCGFSFFVAFNNPRTTARKNVVPEGAIAIKAPNSDHTYMNLWRRNGRVCMVFRNMPNVTIMFDEKVAGELSSSLGEIEKWPSF